jgi:parallel beta-helix repeat protein
MSKYIILLAFQVLSFTATSLDINILKSGAKNNGTTLNTKIIQKAIDRCSAAGAGTIYFPAGNYLTGSIILKSNVTLSLGKGATLLGSTRLEDYLNIKPKFLALRTATATAQLIFAEGQENIAIIGEGTLDGQGKAFKKQGNNDEGIRRPHLLQIIDCRDVKIQGVTFRNSGAWMMHYLACDQLQITGIKVYNHANFNNDGIDIDGCHDVTVSDCIVDSDDDGICLKSTSPRSCKNVVITNCIVGSHCNALKMGTETTGGFQNITISNITVRPSVDSTLFYGLIQGQSALSLEMVDGGLLEKVAISNITVSKTTVPIYIRLGNRARKYHESASQPGVGVLKQVSISNFIAQTSSKISSSITGIPGYPVEDIMLQNIQIINTSSGNQKDIEREVPELITGYPSAEKFGNLPAAGFYVRHARNIRFNNVQVFAEEDDVRPAYFMDDVQKSVISNPLFKSKNAKAELVRQKNSAGISVIPND